MELKVSSPKAECLSPSDCVSDSEEKDVSDDDDDDRNHKHRRREIGSESMERDSLEQVLIRPYRKGNRPFENGHLYRENHSQSNETWKSSNMSPLETDLSAKGRGRESGSWSQHDPRLSIVDICFSNGSTGIWYSKSVCREGVAKCLRLTKPILECVWIDSRNTKWWYGYTPFPWYVILLFPGVSSATFTTCPVFYGISIKLEWNLLPSPIEEEISAEGEHMNGGAPVDLPTLLTCWEHPSALPSVTALSSTFINSKSSKSNRLGMTDDGLDMNGKLQKAPLGLNSSKLHEPEFFLEGSPSDHHHTGLFDGFGNECPMTSTATTVESQITSSSVWGRISTKGNDMKDKIDCNISSSNYIENEAKRDQEPYAILQEAAPFVQFSKREEAEAALKAPDAVMGNGFIKLWWANWDNIPVDGMGSGRDNLQSAAPKLGVPNASVPAVPASDRTKPVVINSPRAPPLQKKQESLELLKRGTPYWVALTWIKSMSESFLLSSLFPLLSSLSRASGLHATSLKGDVSSELAAKRHKPRTVADVAKSAPPRSADIGTVVASPVAEAMAEKDKIYGECCAPKTQTEYLYDIIGAFKLEAFNSSFGTCRGIEQISVVFVPLDELEDVESSDSVVSKNFTAHISFAMRHSVEKAFAKGNCLQGYDLPFIWLAPTNSSNDNSVREKPSSASNIPSDANVQPAREVAPVDPHKVSASEMEKLKFWKEKKAVENVQSGMKIRKLSTISSKKRSPKWDVY
ncbi:zinc finger (CCCH-type) family protein [Actinidia rufa]|uniref:Zinc finger (CCCH-type) family protein n=1 Tax=Actinidia rufa TaxID=165716 RepID=A0A7J0DHQ0_9ERIC|nr:zinc finger (CCCH-type) family protein [Actinidia rufa]